MIIGIDFDGTCVTHDFPEIGKEIGSVPVLKRITQKGHRLILFTMRSDNNDEKHLSKAVDWFSKNNIPLYGIQKNPTQHTWTSSPKAYCNLYIDDAAIGCPLNNDVNLSDRPFVDWEGVEDILANVYNCI